MRIAQALAALLMLSSVAVHAADSWPARPIRFIVPYAAGGATDVTARLLGEQLSQKLGQSVIVENRAGAGGNIGTDVVAKSAADGYTMLLAYAGPIGINQFVYKNLPFDPQRDFAPVSLVADAPLVLVVNPAIPVHGVDELIAYSKANPDKLSYGSSGPGGADHLAGELFNKRTGTSLVHVPYKGGAPAMMDLVGGRIQVQFATIPGALPYIRAGKIVPLAILSRKRFELLPDVPTLAETGMENFEINNWYGIMMPAGTPQPVVQRLNEELVATLKTQAVQERLTQVGLVAQWETPEGFQDFIKDDTAKWEEIVRISGARVD